MSILAKRLLAAALLLSQLSACQAPIAPQPVSSPSPVARVELSALRDSDVTDRLLHHEIDPLLASPDGAWLLMSDYTSENAFFGSLNFFAQRVRKGGYTVLNRRSGEQLPLTGVADGLLQADQAIWLPDGRLAYLGPQNQWRAFDPRNTSDVLLYRAEADERIQFIGLEGQTLLALAQDGKGSVRLIRLDLASTKAQAISFQSNYYSLSASLAADRKLLLHGHKSVSEAGSFPFRIATPPPAKQDLLLLGADGKTISGLKLGLDLSEQAAVSLSPDGRRVLIQESGQLRVMALTADSPVLTRPLSADQRASWLDDGHLLLIKGLRPGVSEPVNRSQLVIFGLDDGKIQQSEIAGEISWIASAGKLIYLRLYHPDPKPRADGGANYHFELVSLDSTGDLQPQSLMSTAPKRDLRLYSFPDGPMVQALPTAGSAADRKIHLYSLAQGRPQEFYSQPGYAPGDFSFGPQAGWSACYCL